MKCWMIRKKGLLGEDLYSTAGSSPWFRTRGKVFYRYSDLTRHLQYFSTYSRNKPYIGAEIVEFDLVESKIKDVSVELNLLSL